MIYAASSQVAYAITFS